MSDEKIIEKDLEFLSARIEKGLPAAFRATVPQGFKVGFVLGAAIKLWVDLPDDVRMYLMVEKKENFVTAVEQIVQTFLQIHNQERTPGNPRVVDKSKSRVTISKNQPKEINPAPQRRLA